MADKRWNEESCFKRLFDQEDECCQGCMDAVECMEGEGKLAEYPKVGPVVEITRKEAVFLVDKLYETFPVLKRIVKRKKMKKIVKWITTPAKWYQFWMPESGPVGGSVAGGILCLLYLLYIRF